MVQKSLDLTKRDFFISFITVIAKINQFDELIIFELKKNFTKIKRKFLNLDT